MPLSEDALNLYVDWIQQGKSFADIREDLQKKGFTADDIKAAISDVDDRLLAAAINKETGLQKINFVSVGIVVILIGAILAIIRLTTGYLSIGLIVTSVSAGPAFIFVGLRLKRKTRISFQKTGRRKFNLKR